MTRGDAVKLKVPEQGRYFKGKILKEIKGSFQVGLPNGLYVIRPIELWELCNDNVVVNMDNTDTNDSEQTPIV